MWGVITHAYPNFNDVFFKPMLKLGMDEYCIPHKTVAVITYPCPNLSWYLLIKGASGVRCFQVCYSLAHTWHNNDGVSRRFGVLVLLLLRHVSAGLMNITIVTGHRREKRHRMATPRVHVLWQLLQFDINLRWMLRISSRIFSMFSANTERNKHVIITSKRSFDVMITYLLRYVFTRLATKIP